MRRLVQILLAFALMLPGFAGDLTFKVDQAHTLLGFKASTLLFDVPGRFASYRIVLTGNPEDPQGAQVKLTIHTASIDTAVKQRDTHLRGEDFFDAATYPVITFTSTKVWKEAGKLMVTGVLDLHGVRKELTLAFDAVSGKNGAGTDTWAFKTTARLNRKDFGIGAESVAARISLKDEVELNLLLVGFFREAAPAPAKQGR